jgi:hypothetical protein
MNLFEQINQSNYIFYFLVVDDFLDITLPQLKNFHLIYSSTPKQKDYLDSQNIPYFVCPANNIQNSGKLLSYPSVKNYINSTSNHKQIIIVPFKPSAKIEFICRQNNWICAAVNHQLNRFLEDKNEFTLFCQKNNLPTVPSNIDLFNQANFTKYQQQFQTNKLVIQTHFGWAGKSTFSADNWEEIKNSIPLETKVKFSPFLTGYSLLNNCCLTSTGLIQSPPALQYTGLPEFTSNPFTTVGRQWPCLAPIEIQNQIRQITADFAKTIQLMSYKGFFGLDFLVSNNQIYLLECNPRLTASFAFYTQIEINQNLNSLFLLHLSQFIDLPNIPTASETQSLIDSAEIIGSEITLKNQDSQTIKKYHDFIAFTQNLDPIIIPQNIINLLHEKG